MDPTIALILGLIGGYVASRLAAPVSGTLPLQPEAMPVTAPLAAAPATRAERMNRLSTILDAAFQSAAQPDEIKGLPAFEEASNLLVDPATPLDDVVAYATGTSPATAAAALAALAKREDGRARSVAERIANRFDTMPAWHMQFALEYLAGLETPLPAGQPILRHQFWWNDNNHVPHVIADYFEALSRRGIDPELGPEAKSLDPDQQQRIKYFLGLVRHPAAARLAADLAGNQPPASTTSEPAGDPSFLQSLGRFWGNERTIDAAIEPARWNELLTDAVTAIGRTPPRSLLVSGDPLVGKTSFLRLVAKRLEADGWRVFEASGADLQAGQLYIGQLEGRIRQALEELAVDKKMIWYVPDLLALALSGTHQGQSSSILDQVMPAIASGRLVIWGEATPASSARLLQMRPAVRRTFEVVRLEPLDWDEALAIAETVAGRIAAELQLTVDPDFAEASLDAASHYLTASALPGSAIALMKLTGARAKKAKGGRLAGRDVLDGLAQLTGLPQSILDGSERLDLAETTAFFSKRVIGQPEAVGSVVERIAMLKSGLNDPMKPFGVFLFAGPTGTGKTELTKAIAEFLFGSTERMIRLDMSEYQHPDSIVKIMGHGGLAADTDTLISRIRKQPFSLLLLDEFEKSSPNVWDLFLQVFDEGRLTDANGQTADFRHCLIILTTNLGATSHQSSGLGFAPRQNAYTNDQVMRAIGQTFRPEFQNRLDKIIVFRPLTREHMRGILKKELDRLFERRGMKDREWAVEWEASALEFLLEKGFSPDMGARPLKRAIDQHVVAPLAAAIVERRAPEGEQFVFVRSDGRELQAEFIDPDGDGVPVPVMPEAQPVQSHPGEVLEAAAHPLPALADILLQPEATPAEHAVLATRAQQIADRLETPEWTDQKAALSAAINDPEFWSRADRFEVLARFELMDRLAVAAATTATLQERLAKGRVKPGLPTRQLVSRLAQQIWLVEQGLRDLDEEAPSEVALQIEPVLDGQGGEKTASAEWRRDIVEMYRAWCRQRNMQLVELEGSVAGSAMIHLVSGFGASRVLAREAGLHILERAETESGPSRITVRVTVVPSPLQGLASRADRRAACEDVLRKAPRLTGVVRRYRRQPSPLVRSADGSWRSGKLDQVLAGEFDAICGLIA